MAFIGDDLAVANFLEAVAAKLSAVGLRVNYTSAGPSASPKDVSVLKYVDLILLFMNFFARVSHASVAGSLKTHLKSMFEHFNVLLSTQYNVDECSSIPKVRSVHFQDAQLLRYVGFCDLFYGVKRGRASGFSVDDYLRVFEQILAVCVEMKASSVGLSEFLNGLGEAKNVVQLKGFFGRLESKLGFSPIETVAVLESAIEPLSVECPPYVKPKGRGLFEVCASFLNPVVGGGSAAGSSKPGVASAAP